MAEKLVYSIKDIFDKTSDNSILKINDADKYSIPSYQRGYKWSSDGSDSQVYKLMSDLFIAYDKKDEKKEYLLQFITLCKKESKKVLEVIDGQQRLTTLSILLSVMNEKISPDKSSIAKELLSYEVREVALDFLNKFVYTNIKTLFDISWDELISQNENYNEQDIWYIFMAAKSINAFLTEKFKNDLEKYKLFSAFILNNVNILLNLIPVAISAEEVFSNLNNNKVELTNSDLIKGLFITYSVRENKIGYRERQELRSRMGRQWDDISLWGNREEIERFYFSNRLFNRSTPLESFLLAFACKEGFIKTEETKKNDIFNFFEDKIRNNSSLAADYFDKLIELKLILSEWYNNKEIHPKLGYLFSLKSNRSYSIKNYLFATNKSKTEINKDLKSDILKVLQSINLSEIEYKKGNEKIHDILLALNIFDKNVAFNFFQFYNTNNWTLEHIFPQNPEDLQTPIGQKDYETIKSLINIDVFENLEITKERLKSLYIENLETVFNSLKIKFYEENLDYTRDEIRILYMLMKTEKLNTIGNMALLTNRDNSSLGNGMFDSKRESIVKRISEGNFVPKHTYDVFSKLFSSSVNKDLKTWNDQDIEAHKLYIESKIKHIQENL